MWPCFPIPAAQQRTHPWGKGAFSPPEHPLTSRWHTGLPWPLEGPASKHRSEVQDSSGPNPEDPSGQPPSSSPQETRLGGDRKQNARRQQERKKCGTEGRGRHRGGGLATATLIIHRQQGMGDRAGEEAQKRYLPHLCWAQVACSPYRTAWADTNCRTKMWSAPSGFGASPFPPPHMFISLHHSKPGRMLGTAVQHQEAVDRE